MGRRLIVRDAPACADYDQIDAKRLREIADDLAMAANGDRHIGRHKRLPGDSDRLAERLELLARYGFT
ncbi:MAG: hypothetical protein ACK4JB_23845 [Reyranella sp.]